MDDTPSVTALFQDEDAAKCQLGPGNDLPTWGISPMDDIPSVTALHQDEANKSTINARCLHIKQLIQVHTREDS